ncbi:hypothetical protein [Hylemonella gracilis]|uniref:hypothetical protein n=1 Tax=Hylemonella gracilis TaxID=80880 RepID=UPI001110F273|nr:hypothetical protein [Hylemonella gracilis]
MSETTLLAKASPQEAKISRDKLDRVIEPLQGHMSGSPGEITAIADAAAGDRRPFTRGMEGRHVGPLTGGSRAQTEAASALASAFLIGQGFHSAVEVYESVKKHQGEDIFQGRGDRGKRDASDVAGNGEATAFISDLMKRHTAPETREIAASLKPSVSVSSTRSNSAGTLAKEGIFPITPERPGPHRGTDSKHYGSIESRPRWH